MAKRIKWTDALLEEEAKKYKNKDEFRKKNNAAYQAARRRGKKFFDNICSHMPKRKDISGEKNPNYKWSYSDLKNEAKKYGRLVDFQYGSPVAYVTSINRGILKKISKHMITRNLMGINNPNFKWTDKEIRLGTLQYNSLVELQKKNGALYQAAWARNLLKEVSSHMKPSRSSSLAERELLSSIRIFFPNAKKIIDCNVKIKNKSHIKRFEIDIYIPELNVGIEYDGDYYHSFEKMRSSRSKNLWSDDDIRNYHEIKDAWFATKGIKILHIKSQNWSKNKDVCVSEIEKFLNITNFMLKTNGEVMVS